MSKIGERVEERESSKMKTVLWLKLHNKKYTVNYFTVLDCKRQNNSLYKAPISKLAQASHKST